MAHRQRVPKDMGEDFARVARQVREESDRGCALILGAWLDELLRELLEAHLVEGTATKALFASFSSPLGPFSARIHACHSLGLIELQEWNCLDKLREIRNVAAHFDKKIGFAFSFDESSVAAKIRGLPLVGERVRQATPRAVFVVMASMLIASLILRLRKPDKFATKQLVEWTLVWDSFPLRLEELLPELGKSGKVEKATKKAKRAAK
jgi:hypothetical protein